MSEGILPAACLCLFSGALLGGMFLAFKLLRLLLHGGKLCMAVFDVLLGLACAVTAFLCALALDKGRLRLFQVLLQGLGAWGAVVSLDPLIDGMAAGIRKAGRWLRGFMRRRIWQPCRRGLGRLGGVTRKAARKVLPKRKPPVRKARRGRKRARSRKKKGLPGRRAHGQTPGRNGQNDRKNVGSLQYSAPVTSQSRK